MATYAVIESGTVVNVILADSKEIAESIVGSTCIEYTNENPAMIGGTYDGETFIEIKTYPSWVLNSNKKWEAPTPMPIDDKSYAWNEETLSWVEFVVEEETI